MVRPGACGVGKDQAGTRGRQRVCSVVGVQGASAPPLPQPPRTRGRPHPVDHGAMAPFPLPAPARRFLTLFPPRRPGQRQPGQGADPHGRDQVLGVQGRGRLVRAEQGPRGEGGSRGGVAWSCAGCRGQGGLPLHVPGPLGELAYHWVPWRILPNTGSLGESRPPPASHAARPPPTSSRCLRRTGRPSSRRCWAFSRNGAWPNSWATSSSTTPPIPRLTRAWTFAASPWRCVRGLGARPLAWIPLDPILVLSPGGPSLYPSPPVHPP